MITGLWLMLVAPVLTDRPDDAPASAPASTAAVAPDLSAFVEATPRCAPTVAHCFGIHLHVVHTDAGPVQDVAWVSAQLEQAQRHFALIGTSFEVVAADALPASELEIDDRDARDALGHARFTRGVVHVFVVGRLADHAALAAAARGGPVLCVAIVEPALWAQPDAARRRDERAVVGEAEVTLEPDQPVAHRAHSPAHAAPARGRSTRRPRPGRR